MGGVTRNGLGHATAAAQRKQFLEAAAARRDVEFAGGAPAFFSGTPEKLDARSSTIFVVPGAGHVDLYDRTKLIPFEKAGDLLQEQPAREPRDDDPTAREQARRQDEHRRHADGQSLRRVAPLDLAGMDPSVGDLTYYAPWGNLAIFARLDGEVKVTIETVDEPAR